MNRMILTGEPFVSDYLKETIIRNRFSVIGLPGSRELLGRGDFDFIQEKEAAELLNSDEDSLLYTVSESGFEWVDRNIGEAPLNSYIEIFKNKRKFRDLTRALYPSLFYKEVTLDQLENLDPDGIKLPAVIKPSVGFFSLGVNTIHQRGDWEPAIRSILEEASSQGRYYPDSILDTSRFIIEEYIEGDEYAVDIYAGRDGKPVVVGILKHLFGAGDDVSDRVYITSADIVEEKLDQFTRFADRIISLAGLKDFPFHAEVRIDSEGKPVPIEINPLRFGAWCTTADLTGYAFGLNPYEYYFERKEPSWPELLQSGGSSIYSLIALNNSTGISADRIRDFDYNKLVAGFEKVLETRKWDFRKNPLFGFLITETSGNNISELENILHSDLSEFVIPYEG